MEQLQKVEQVLLSQATFVLRFSLKSLLDELLLHLLQVKTT
jgi:hypothetical protein